VREERRVHRDVIRPLLELQATYAPAAVPLLCLSEQLVDLRPHRRIRVDLDFVLERLVGHAEIVAC